MLDAEAALALGIITTVVDDADVADQAEQTAYRLAQGPTAALGRIKRLLGASSTATLAEQLAAEAEAIAASAAGPEGSEGLSAFLEKRAPRFHG